jgi:hypothetical protein
MALTFAYRQAIRNRKRGWRRFEVVFFFALMAMGLVEGCAPLAWSNLGVKMTPYLLVITRVFIQWKQQQVVTVGSLDDHAVAEFGVGFERTTPSQQRELLDHYRVGTFPLNSYPDEYDAARVREAHLRAYDVLRLLLPALAVLYWIGWRVLPKGNVHTAWTNGPVVLTWLVLLVLALPQIISMWTEPNDPVEPKLAVAAREEA